MNFQLSELRFTLSDLGLAEYSDSPVRDALARVFVEKLNTICAAIARAMELRQQEETKTLAAEEIMQVEPLMFEWAELVSWLFPYVGAVSRKDALSYALRLREAGVEADVAERTSLDLEKARVGRPHTRGKYIAVFDLMLQSEKVSLGRALQKLYPNLTPEELVHERSKIKPGIVNLKKLLRRHAPELLSRYDALHPDRAQLPGQCKKNVNG